MKNLFQKYMLFTLILPLATVIRIYKLGEKQLWVDEIIQIMHSSQSSLKEILLGVRGEIAAAPMDFIVQHVFITVFGRSEFSARLHAAIFGILTVIVFYYLTQMVFDIQAAKIASLLYAVYPLHHHYSQEGRFYALFVFVALCSYFVFLKLLLKRKNKYWLYYSSLTVLLLYTHYYAVLVITSQFLFLCFMFSSKVQESFLPIRKVDVTFFCKLLASVAISAMLFVPWVIFAWTSTRGSTPEHFHWKLLFRAIKELSDGSYPLSFALVSLTIFGTLKLKSEQKYGHLFFLLSWLLLPVPFILCIIWLRDYFFAIRQILFTTPALFILVSCGIVHASEMGTRANNSEGSKIKALIVSVILLISAGTIFLHISDKRVDLKAAGQFLQRNVSKGDIIIAPRLVPILSYYFPQIHTYTQDITSLENINDMLGSGQRIYIVKSVYMPASNERLIDAVYRRYSNHKTLNFRGIQIIEITVGSGLISASAGHGACNITNMDFPILSRGRRLPDALPYKN